MAAINTLINLDCTLGDSVDTTFCPLVEQKYMQSHVAYRMHYLMSQDSNGKMRAVWPGMPYECQNNGWTLFRNAKFYSGQPLIIGGVSYSGNSFVYSSGVGDTRWETSIAGSSVVLGMKDFYAANQQIDSNNRNNVNKMIITEDENYPTSVNKLIDRVSWISTETQSSVRGYGGHLSDAPQGLMLWGSFPNLGFGGGMLLRSKHQLQNAYMHFDYSFQQRTLVGYVPPEKLWVQFKLVATDSDNGWYYYYMDAGIYVDFTNVNDRMNAINVYVTFPYAVFTMPNDSDKPTFAVQILDSYLKIR